MDKQKRYSCFNRTRIGYTVILIFVAGASSNTFGASTAFLDANAILEGWESNYGSISSMQVSYTEQVLDAEPPAAEPSSLDSLVRWQHVERVEQEKKYHIRYSTSQSGFADHKNLMEHAFDGSTTQEYWGVEETGVIDRGLTGRNVETMNVLKAYMLLDPQSVGGEMLKSFPDGVAPRFSLFMRLGLLNSAVKTQPKLELMAGEWCHVVELFGNRDGTNCQFRFWIAHDKGMLPVKYQSYYENRLVDQIEVEELGFAETDSGKIWYPVKAKRTTDWKDRGLIKYGLSTKAFLPNVKTDRNSFRFDFPNGTKIVDRILNLYYIKGVRDIDGVAIVQDLDPSNEEPSKATAVATTDTDIPFRKKVPTQSANAQMQGKDTDKVVVNSNNDIFATRKTIVLIGLLIVPSLFVLLWYKRHRKGQRG